jgi:DNA-binding response OmpR family regulator
MNGAKGTAADVERPIRVLVVDDEQILTEMLSMGLSYEGFDVHVARTGPEALEQAQRLSPDLMVLDIMLPGVDGLEVCRRLSGRKDMAIIMLTARGEVEDRIAGLDIGADDYLAKPFAFRELLARIRAVLRRRGINLQQVLSAGDVTLDRESRRVTRAARQVELTPLEFDLLELLMAHPRQVFPREILLNRVWGLDYRGDTNAIDVHVHNLREKLGDANRSLIRSVRGIGYTLELHDEKG